jgi:hypothetical protein
VLRAESGSEAFVPGLAALPADLTAIRAPTAEHAPEVRALPEPGAVRRFLGGITAQLRDLYSYPGVTGTPAAERAEAILRNIETYGEKEGLSGQEIQARLNEALRDLEPSLAESIGRLLGYALDPATLALGAGGERLAVSAVQGLAARGVRPAATLLRLMQTPETASFARRLLARAVHGATVGGAVNLPIEAASAIREDRALTPGEAAKAFAIGTVAGPALEAAGAAAFEPLRRAVARHRAAQAAEEALRAKGEQALREVAQDIEAASRAQAEQSPPAPTAEATAAATPEPPRPPEQRAPETEVPPLPADLATRLGALQQVAQSDIEREHWRLPKRHVASALDQIKEAVQTGSLTQEQADLARDQLYTELRQRARSVALPRFDAELAELERALDERPQEAALRQRARQLARRLRQAVDDGIVTADERSTMLGRIKARLRRPEPVEVEPPPAPPQPPVGPPPKPAELLGRPTEIITPNRRFVARYRVVSASDLIASHDPETFQPRPDYPEGVQERRYHADQAAQLDVIRVSQELDPRLVLDPTVRATDGPPTIDEHNRVLGGNTRTLALQRAYARGSSAAEAYRQALIERAEEFGISRQAVQAVKDPVLVRELSDVPPTRGGLAEVVSAFNDVGTKAKDPLADAATRARRLRDSDEVLAFLEETLEPEETIADYLRRQGPALMRELTRAQVVLPQEVARFLDTRTGALTEEGRTLLERVFYAAAIPDVEVLARAPKAILQRLEHAIPSLVRVSRLPGWDLTGRLGTALDLHAERQAKGFRSVADLLEQGSLFKIERDPQAVAIAALLEQPKATVRQLFQRYATMALEASRQLETHDLFGYVPPDPAQALDQLLAPLTSGRVAESYQRYVARATAHEARRAVGPRFRDLPGQLEFFSGDMMAVPDAHGPWATRWREFVRLSKATRAWVPIIGQRISNAVDAYRLLRPWRSPAYEYLHIIATDDAGKVVFHQPITSGLVDQAATWDATVDSHGTRTLWYFSRSIRRAGGTKVILVHNHPSGRTYPSDDDIANLFYLSRKFRDYGLRLKGSLVIDGEELHWMVLRGEFKPPKIDRVAVPPELWPVPDWTDTLGEVPQVTDAFSALRLVRDRRGPLVLYINSEGRVLAAEPHSMAAMERLGKWLPQRRRHWAASHVFLVFHGEPDWTTGVRLVNRYRSELDFVADVLDTKYSRSAQLDLVLKPARERPAPSVRIRERMPSEGMAESVPGYHPRAAPEEVEEAADRGSLAPVTPFQHGFDPRTAQESGQPLTPGKGLLTVKARAQIIGEIARALDIPIREALPRRRKWAGLYFPRGREVRLKLYSDIETVAHEVGHHIQTLLFGPDAYTRQGNLSQRPFAPWRHELAPLDYDYPQKKRSTEGFAEFLRRYVTNPVAAQRRAPTFFSWFEARLEGEHPDLKNMLLRARRDYQLWLEAGPRARLRSMLQEPDPIWRFGPVRDRWLATRQAAINDLALVRAAVEDVQRRAGLSALRISEHAARLMQLVRGSGGLAAEFLDGRPRSWGDLRPNGVPSLEEIVQEFGDRYDDFWDYAIARRARELAEHGFPTGISKADAEAVVRELDSPEFRRAFSRLADWQNSLLQLLVDSGVISSRLAEVLRQMYPDFLPFERQHPEERALRQPGSRFAHLFQPVKRMKGSGLQLVHPAEALVRRAYWWSALAYRQQVSRALAALADLPGAAKWIRRAEQPPRKVLQLDLAELAEVFGRRFGAEEEFLKFLDEQGIALDEVLAFFRPAEMLREQNIISLLQPDGKRVYYEVDPKLYEALAGLDRELLQAWQRWIAAPARFLRAGAVLAPEFQIRNPVRDQLTAFIQSEYGYVPFVDLAFGLFHLLRRTDLYGLWRAAGGQRASLLGLDRATYRRMLAEVARSRGERIRDVVFNPVELLRLVSETMEDATRLGEFRRAVRRRGTDRNSLWEAAFSSREVTVDFALRGAKTSAIRMLTAFWNAKLQSYDRMLREMRTHPARFTARAVASVTMPSLLLYLVNRDDPDYQRQPQWVRDLFWLIPIGRHADGTTRWLKVPKPFEPGIIFGSVPERILEWMDSQDPTGVRHALEALGRDVLDIGLGMTPLGWTAIQPLIENLANYDLYFQRPLVPRRYEAVEPRYQYEAGRNDISRALFRFLKPKTGPDAGVLDRLINSPDKIDNLLDGWFAGLGRTASDIAEVIARASPLEPVLTAPPVPGDKVIDLLPGPWELPIRETTPGVRALFQRPAGRSSESVERFYARFNAASRAEATYRELSREDPEDAVRYFEQHTEELSEYRLLRDVADRIAALRARGRLVRFDADIPDEERRNELRAIDDEISALAESVLPPRRKQR